MKGFTTKAIHTKFLREDSHKALHMPIYENVAFEFDSSEDIEMAFTGRKPNHMYSRITNPTVEHFEQKIKHITNAFTVLALSSGMAAISNLIIAATGAGDNIITSKHLFGNSISLFEKTLKQWELKVKYTDFNKPENIESVIDEKTRIIFLETITNPQLEIADLEKISAIANKYNILVVVDSTVTPLYFCNMKEMGIHVETLSSTKYISGGATSVGGLIIDYGNYDWSHNINLKDSAKKFGPFALINKLKKESYRNLGACLSPNNAYMQSLGLETLALRAERTSNNAMELASFLDNSEKVLEVNYPGLKKSIYNKIATKQFSSLSGNCLYGGLLTFRLKDKEECFRFMNNLKIIKRATNFNDNKSLIIHPASTIFAEFNEEEKENMGVHNNMIRLAAGIEDIDDLKEDIKKSLEEI